MTKIAGSGSESGSISQRHGSADPHQNVMDPQDWFKRLCADLLETDVDKVPHLVAEYPGGEARRRLVHNVLQQLEDGHRLVHTAYNTVQDIR